MCQHFSGHTVKQLYSAINNQPVTNNYYYNANVAGYKKLQYIGGVLKLKYIHA
jgi:hypothetical protein